MATVDRPGGRLMVMATFLDRSDRWLEKSHPIQNQWKWFSLRGRDSL
jgi:hypothetical protein